MRWRGKITIDIEAGDEGEATEIFRECWRRWSEQKPDGVLWIIPIVELTEHPFDNIAAGD